MRRQQKKKCKGPLPSGHGSVCVERGWNRLPTLFRAGKRMRRERKVISTITNNVLLVKGHQSSPGLLSGLFDNGHKITFEG